MAPFHTYTFTYSHGRIQGRGKGGSCPPPHTFGGKSPPQTPNPQKIKKRRKKGEKRGKNERKRLNEGGKAKTVDSIF